LVPVAASQTRFTHGLLKAPTGDRPRIRWGSTFRLPNLSSGAHFHPSRWAPRSGAVAGRTRCQNKFPILSTSSKPCPTESPPPPPTIKAESDIWLPKLKSTPIVETNKIRPRCEPWKARLNPAGIACSMASPPRNTSSALKIAPISPPPLPASRRSPPPARTQIAKQTQFRPNQTPPRAPGSQGSPFTPSARPSAPALTLSADES
jgi:hypothetical protein